MLDEIGQNRKRDQRICSKICERSGCVCADRRIFQSFDQQRNRQFRRAGLNADGVHGRDAHGIRRVMEAGFNPRDIDFDIICHGCQLFNSPLSDGHVLIGQCLTNDGFSRFADGFETSPNDQKPSWFIRKR